MLEVYVICFYGIEKKIPPFAKAYGTEEEMWNAIDSICERKNLVIKSENGWDNDYVYNDCRCEDEDGNTFYFVITRQAVSEPNLY